MNTEHPVVDHNEQCRGTCGKSEVPHQRITDGAQPCQFWRCDGTGPIHQKAKLPEPRAYRMSIRAKEGSWKCPRCKWGLAWQRVEDEQSGDGRAFLLRTEALIQEHEATHPEIVAETEAARVWRVESLEANLRTTIRNIEKWPATMTHERIARDLNAALDGKLLEELT